MGMWRPVSQERANELWELYFEKGRPASAAKELRDIYERHFFADVANWDFDRDMLLGILSEPEVDRGTISLIFWRASPDFFQSYEESEVPNYQRDLYEVVVAARARMEARDWASEELVYDPIKDGRGDPPPADAKWEIPREWAKPTPGRKMPGAYTLMK